MFRSTFILLLAALLPACLFAQTPDSAVSGAEWLKGAIRNNVTSRTDAITEPTREVNWHYVFLVNATPVASQSAYAEFTRNMIVKFLDERLAERQANRQDPSKDFVSFIPYQLDLYREGGQAITREPLSVDTIKKLDEVFPKTPFRTRADGTTPFPRTGGHDNVTTRRQIMLEIGDPNQAVPTILIQFTNIALNEDPGNPENDQAIRPLTGSSGLVEGTEFDIYEVPGQPFQAAVADSNGKPIVVHTWLYGPSTFSAAEKLAATPAPAEPAEPSEPFNPMPIIVGVSLLAALAIAFLVIKKVMSGAARGVSVKVGNEVTHVFTQRDETVEVHGPGSQAPIGATINLHLEGARPECLFTIRYTGKEVVIDSRSWRVTTPLSDQTPVRLPTDGEFDILCSDLANNRREVRITCRVPES